jgi:hypothetical protein
VRLAVLLAIALVAAPVAPAAAGQDNADLLAYYARRKNWKKVKREVLSWHKTTRNACVAFLSTALRHVGLDVPRDAEVDGEKVSRLTLPLSRWLEERLGWERVVDVDALAPGDVVFTENAEYPWHVYVFHSWRDEEARIARVIDNQGFLTARDVLGHGPGNFTPFAYALRSPE